MRWWITKEPSYIPSLFNVLYTCPVYERDDFPSKAMTQFCTKRSILFWHQGSGGRKRGSPWTLANAISTKKWSPSFLTRVWGEQIVLTLRARNCTDSCGPTELSWLDFYQEMVSVILGMNEATKCTHTQVQKVLVRILVVQLSLQCRAHSVFVG